MKTRHLSWVALVVLGMPGLGRAEQGAAKPARLLLLLSAEGNCLEAPKWRGWWEIDPAKEAAEVGELQSQVAQHLTEAGHFVLAPEHLDAKATPALQALRAGKHDDKLLGQLAAEAKVDFVLFGRARATDSGLIAGTRMTMQRGMVDFRLVGAGASDAQAHDTTATAAAHIDARSGCTVALRKAAKKTAEVVVQRLQAITAVAAP